MRIHCLMSTHIMRYTGWTSVGVQCHILYLACACAPPTIIKNTTHPMNSGRIICTVQGSQFNWVEFYCEHANRWAYLTSSHEWLYACGASWLCQATEYFSINKSRYGRIATEVGNERKINVSRCFEYKDSDTFGISGFFSKRHKHWRSSE